MGLLDSNTVKPYGGQMPVTLGGEYSKRIKTLVESQDYIINEFSPNPEEDSMSLSAAWQNIAVFTKPNAIYISTTGINGDVTKVDLNTTNFPNLIEGSYIKKIAIVPYTRRITSSESIKYRGVSWRLVVFTGYGQIYHNFPSRANGYDGASHSGDITKFDESVVWDLPERKFPVKTESGGDATLIATGKYRYMPCLPDHMYEMHPGLNVDNGYGNDGFDAVRTYTDYFTHSETKRARYFVPVRGFADADSFDWISGYLQDSRMTVIGTYLSALTYNARTVLLTTNDGREWFVQYEYGCMGQTVAQGESGEIVISSPWNTSAEYNGISDRIYFGTNTMSDSNAFLVKKRSQYVPSVYNKEPELTHKFKYGTPIAIESISSDSANGIIVTTSSNHGLVNGDIIVIEKVSTGNADWNWICSEEHTATSAGNGVVWRVSKLSNTTFRLNLEVKNPYNNLSVRHIHSVNRVKDGYIIGCGENYPNGWIEYMQVLGGDNFDNVFAGNEYPMYRLTSTSTSVQRILGMQFYQESGDNMCYFGLDTSDIVTPDVTMPSGRTESFYRNSLGIYKAKLENIDDFSNCECIYNSTQPAYFFKEVCGIMIFVGMRGKLALSKDYGKSWTTFQLPSSLYSCSWLLGVTNSKEICLKYYAHNVGGNTLIIKPRV